MNFKTKDFLDNVVSIVTEASNLVMNIYNNHNMNVVYKNDQSPLTIADTECAEFINLKLNKLTPSINIINEETSNKEFCDRKNEKYHWLVDPIDGTKEFIKKTDDFTVNIGLVENNKVILGVVSIPAKNIVYYGSIYCGSFKKNYFDNSSEIKINPNVFDLTKNNIIVGISKSHMNNETTDYLNNLNLINPQFVSAGSSLKILYVADGTFDFYPRLGPTMEWDICAAHAIIKSAGGNIYDLNNNEIIYNKEDLHNPYFIVKGL